METNEIKDKNAIMALKLAIDSMDKNSAEESKGTETTDENKVTKEEEVISREIDTKSLDGKKLYPPHTVISCGLQVGNNTKNDVIYVCPKKYQSFKFTALKCCGGSDIFIKYVGSYNTSGTWIFTPYGNFDISRGEIFFQPDFRSYVPEGTLVSFPFKAFACGVSTDFWVDVVFTSCACCCPCNSCDC